MNKLLLCLLCALALFAAVVPCFADTVNGVLAEERVVNLPNDQGKWYISVVGDSNDARYNEILNWFDNNPNLAKLKDQVQFCPVTSDTAIYKERYAPNVAGLPTVRMQQPDAVVVYEAAGKDLPMTAAGLNGALAGAVGKAQGLRPILPWRRDTDNRLNNLERPKPQPQPNHDPEPQPINDGGKPEVVNPDLAEPESVLPGWLVVPIGGAGFLVGFCLGYGKKLKEKLLPATHC
jgi:hypothetical protein